MQTGKGQPYLLQGKRVKVTGTMEPHRQEGNHFVLYNIDEIKSDAEYDAHLLMVGGTVVSCGLNLSACRPPNVTPCASITACLSAATLRIVATNGLLSPLTYHSIFLVLFKLF